MIIKKNNNLSSPLPKNFLGTFIFDKSQSAVKLRCFWQYFFRIFGIRRPEKVRKVSPQ